MRSLAISSWNPARRQGGVSALLMLVLLSSSAAPALGQTPTTAVGLGAPVAAIDARAAALGGTGIGLLGGSLSARNPADMGFFGQPVLGITYAPESVSVQGSGGELETGRSRMPVLRGAIPFDEWTLGVAFASELDQDWQVEFSDTLSTTQGTFPFSEQRISDGGVSSVNFTLTRKLAGIQLGVEYGILTGNLRRRFVRVFESDTADVSNNIASSVGGAAWSYAGSRLRMGAAGDITDKIRVSADFSLQGDLTALRDSSGVELGEQVFAMPAAFEAGGSAQISRSVLVTGAVGWTGWSGTEGNSTQFVASDVIWAGVGAEFKGARLFGADLPLRLGFRRTDLPFHAAGLIQPKETALTLGLGLRVSDEQARIDLAFEFGSRGDLAESGVEESFQRLSVSVALFQR